MFGIGMPEMLLLLAIALIVIGPKKLPDLAKSLGRALGEFKKATSDLKESMEIDSELKDVKTAFDDLNQDIKTSIDTYPSTADKTTSELPAPDAPPTNDAATQAVDDDPTADVEIPPEPDDAAVAPSDAVIEDADDNQEDPSKT